MAKNIDTEVVAGFGDEWTRYDQSKLDPEEHERMFANYFHIFPWEAISTSSVGFDLGCGSGRWAVFVAPRVAKLILIDPSDAIEVAKENLHAYDNCEFHRSGVDDIPIPDESCDFGYSLGVLHHIPDTAGGLRGCVTKLKIGAPFLVYLYYRFDNRPLWFRAIWKVTDIIRRLISRMPYNTRHLTCQLIAGIVYFPLARLSKTIEKGGFDISWIPLSQYRNNSFYTMRTDALDRFGTKLEKRFTKAEIRDMMIGAGLDRITFSDRSFWTAVGFRVS